MTSAALFHDVFLGGFQCSCHRLADGGRFDLAATAQHLKFVDRDYMRVRSVGMNACRDGVSWIRTARPGQDYDFSCAVPMVRAAERHGLHVIWDLMHSGWPADIDPFAPSFPTRFGRYAKAFARWITSETDVTQLPLMVAPINEMSFLAWAGGDIRGTNPYEAARSIELNIQLVRATIEAIEAIRDVAPYARFIQPEPIVHVASSRPTDDLVQFLAWDMLRGQVWPEVGGDPKYLDIVGVNFFPESQFLLDGTILRREDVRYKPLAKMLVDVWARYRRPMLLSETGGNGDERAPWLHYASGQCVIAMRHGVELHGIAIHSIASHPEWLDERNCQTGLWEYADNQGNRVIHLPMLDEIQRQRGRLLAARAEVLEQKLAVGL
jgi:hypothetical protein